MNKKNLAGSALCLFMLFFLSSSGLTTSQGTLKYAIKDVYHVSSAKPTPPAHPMAATPKLAVVDRPVRLIIPAIQVDAAVETVGLQTNGDLNTPQEHPLDDVGWYDMGPQPGGLGSAVIDGHLDRPGGAPAVFWYLNNLLVGDDVMVVSRQGKTLHFRVTSVQAYAPQSAPLQAIFGDMSGKYLNLITCAGDWIPSEHQTTQRLVVYTSLVQ